jgi:prepilin-type N-terminal cleavage/methylation domain-containing protein
MKHTSRGFTLLEVVVAMAIFGLFTLGIYSSIQFALKSVYQSRTRTLETSLAQEWLETARNVAYGSVGILGGSPPGVLPHTQTITRNGEIFTLTTTVRNIDDPFDGTIGGTTNDTSPADYKLVQVEVLCSVCSQQVPVTLSAIVAPKNLEGATNNGALFLHVFDANGISVAGANMHVVNTSVTPNLVIDDVTDNQGMLKLIDVPTSTQGYHITVSKSGYSTDATATSSASNPNPTKLPATVVSQSITDLSFAIDHTASAQVSTINPSCTALPNTLFNLWGDKVIGANPTVFKFKQKVSTDGAGNYTFPTLEWDTYHVSNSSTAYDLSGTIPMMPLKIVPSSSNQISVVLRPHTAHSLLVRVPDAGTGLPLSDATVTLTGTGYAQTAVTNLGYTRQTDWSGGYGQSDFSDQTKYWSQDTNIDVTSAVGDLKLKKVGMAYVGSGQLESSTIDLGTGVTFRSIVPQPLSQPVQTGSNPVLFQIATSGTSTPAAWNFLGPDGTSATYYSLSTTTIFAGHNGDQYVRYRVFLSTANSQYTPLVSELAFTYTTTCVPPGQVFFNGLTAGTYTLTVSAAGYTTNMGNISVNGQTETTVNLSPI